jgi:hypothetical protein
MLVTCHKYFGLVFRQVMCITSIHIFVLELPTFLFISFGVYFLGFMIYIVWR